MSSAVTDILLIVDLLYNEIIHYLTYYVNE